MIFDTHAHYDDERFDEDREALLASMRDAGIGNIVNIGANMASSQRSLDLAGEHDFMYAAVGVHPSDCAELDDEKIEKLKEMSSFDKCVAIGEIGLDYYWPEPDHELAEVRDGDLHIVRGLGAHAKVRDLHAVDLGQDCGHIERAL